MMRTRSVLTILLFASSLLFSSSRVFADAKNGQLDIYWVDVEGGAATLLVTPAGESILFDTGLPGKRDPGRIHHVATRVAKLERIDHLVVTHFDSDHYGGAVDLSKLMPIGRIYDPGLPGRHRFDRWGAQKFASYVETFKERRTVLKPGDSLDVKQTGGTPISFFCLGARQSFITPRGPSKPGQCDDQTYKPVDKSENRNSTVFVVRFGKFKFLDAADLTWNLERQLVCPLNLVGQVDVFQVDHHGLDSSNNPVLIRSVEPRVAVVNNGPTKGNMPNTFKTLKSVASIESIYQLHRNLKVGPEGNTAKEMICNESRECEATHLELSVDASGDSYEFRVPSTGHKKRYAAW